MDKQQLKAYYEALHGVLEREMTEEPPTELKALRKACRELERHLVRCPNGDELITVAKANIQFFMRFATV